MGLHLITTMDLKNLKEEIISELEGIYEAYAKAADKELLNSYEVKKLLHISAATLRTHRLNGNLRAVKRKGVLYYDKKEVNRLLRNNRQPPAKNDSSESAICPSTPSNV
jgi:hypothetical protein